MNPIWPQSLGTIQQNKRKANDKDLGFTVLREPQQAAHPLHVQACVTARMLELISELENIPATG